MTTPVDTTALETALKRLKLRRIRELLASEPERAQLAEFTDPLQLVNYLVTQEVIAREATQREQRVRAARFPQTRTLADFDFDFQPAVSEQQLLELAELDFIQRAENVLFLGPSGVGKTHLALALGHAAVEAGYRVRFTTAEELTGQLYASLADGTFRRELDRYSKFQLLIIDELGFLALDRTASNHFFQIINQAYERQAVIVTSNRPFQEWSGILHDPVIVTAILDRLLHHAHLFNLKGESYRLREHVRTHGKGVAPLT